MGDMQLYCYVIQYINSYYSCLKQLFKKNCIFIYQNMYVKLKCEDNREILII